MNKRQAKKACKKVIRPLVDEMNLLTLSPEEYEKAISDYEEWVRRYCRYKHYKDRYKKLGIARNYHFPVGEECKKRLEQVLEKTNGRHIETKTVLQSIQELKETYGSIDGTD